MKIVKGSLINVIEKFIGKACVSMLVIMATSGFVLPNIAQAQVYQYSSVAGFSTLDATQRPFDFMGTGDLLARQLSTPGSGITQGTASISFSPPGGGACKPGLDCGNAKFL